MDIKFEESFFYRGYRPFIAWIVVVTLILLFPINILLIFIGNYLEVSMNISNTVFSTISTPIITLTFGIMGFRSFDKLKNNKSKG